jgi:hypothetical protein
MAKSRARTIAARRRAATADTGTAYSAPENNPGARTGIGEPVGKAGLGMPSTINVKQRIKEAREAAKAAGQTGKQLRETVKQARQSARGAQNEELWASIPEEIRPYVKNPRKWIRKNIKGIQPFRRLAAIQQVDEALGLSRAEKEWEEHRAKQVDEQGRPIIDFREEEEPLMAQMEGYVGERLGKGFTPEERAAYYGSMHDPLKAQEAQNYESEMSRLAAAGMDPRSGIAASRAAGIQATTGRGLAEAGRKTEEANLARKAQIEGYAQDLSALEERKRADMVDSTLGRLGKLEEGMAGAAGLGERGRQFDYELAEGQRQAQQRREDIKKAADRMEPSTLEKVAGGISGFLGGLTGGS